MTKRFKTSVQRGRCHQKRRGLCSTRLRKPSRQRQLSIWGERRCSGHRWKSGRDRMIKTWEKNVVLFVDERGTLKRNARSSKALQVCTPVTLWCSQSHLKGNLLFRVLYYLFLQQIQWLKRIFFKKCEIPSPSLILIFYKSETLNSWFYLEAYESNLVEFLNKIIKKMKTWSSPIPKKCSLSDHKANHNLSFATQCGHFWSWSTAQPWKRHQVNSGCQTVCSLSHRYFYLNTNMHMCGKGTTKKEIG